MDQWHDAAVRFAKLKGRKIDWVTYAGFSPEEVANAKNEPPYYPFKLRDDPVEYWIIIENGKYTVKAHGIARA
jgi:hypothetical protein